MADVVTRHLEDGVAVVSLNRPERHNAINDELYDAWRDAMHWAAGSADVRAVVVRGEGRSFSSGRDTSELGHRPAGQSDYHFVRHHQETRLHDLECPKPVIAALKGAVIGGGLEAALGADIRIAATDVKLGFPETRFGIMTDTGGAGLTTILAGPSRAKWLIMTGELIGADRALAWGLVDDIVAPEELDDVTLALAKRLAAGPPLALAMAKQVIDNIWAGALRSTFRAELLAQTALFRSDDYREARAARTEGREPRYQGR